MIVRNLSVSNFRNHEGSLLSFHDGLNFLRGPNGAGKTAILEALSLASSLRSFRAAKLEDLIQTGSETAKIEVVAGSQPHAADPGWTAQFTVVLGKETGRLAQINGRTFRRSSEYLAQRFGSVELGFHCVVIQPTDHDLIRGDPSGRRSYWDRVLSAEDLTYLRELTRYQRVLMQRNALLRAGQPVLREFNDALVTHGARVTRCRMQWVFRASRRLQDIGDELVEDTVGLSILYGTSYSFENKEIEWKRGSHFTRLSDIPSLETLENAFHKTLEASRGQERVVGSTLTGPHREDWSLEFGHFPLKGHGSQGETRAALLALKWTEIELFQEATGHRPILLLDDLSSELDASRRRRLLELLGKTTLQVVVTTTEEEKDDGPHVGKTFRLGKQRGESHFRIFS